jgi:predicted DNA-binding protein
MADPRSQRKQSPSKSTAIGVRLPLTLRKSLEALAKADQRTLSSLVQKILSEYIGKSRGK